MKKRFGALWLSVLSLTLGGCGFAPVTPSDPTVKPETKYTVSYVPMSDFTISGLNNGYKSGETVTFTVNVLNSQKEISSVKANNVACSSLFGTTYGFTMPSQNVTLSVTLRDKVITQYNVTCSSSSDYTVTGLQSQYASGELVSFTVTVTNSEKQIDSVKQNTTTLSGDNGNYSFYMPARDVSITIQLRDKSSGGSFSFDLLDSYVMKSGHSRSELQGAPWINSNLSGQVSLIEKPSIKDDFYVGVNYDDLVANNPGPFDNASARVQNALNTIMNGTGSNSNKALLQRVKNIVADGAINDVTNYLNNLTLSSLVTSKDLFLVPESLFKVEKYGGAYYVYYNDGYMNGEYGLQTLDFFSEYADYAFNITNWLNYGFLGSEIDSDASYQNVVGFEYDMVLTAYNSYVNNNGYAWTKYNWTNTNHALIKDAILDYGLTSTDTIYISGGTVNVLTNMFGSNYSDTVRNDVVKRRMMYNFRVLSGIDIYPAVSFYMASTGMFGTTNIYGADSDIQKMYMTIELLKGVVEKDYLAVDASATVKQDVQNLIDEIRQGYIATAENYTWLDETTKAGVLRKLNKMKSVSCYSDKVKNYPKMDESNIDSMSLFNITKRYYSYVDALAMAGNLETDSTWGHYASYVTNAFYSPGINSFVILNGILGLYDDTSIETKLASLGYVIGHEISHSIDSSGANYDENGNRVNWWTNESKAVFDRKVGKVMNFFSNITVYGDTKLDGDVVDGEATADMGGIHIALEIAKNYSNFDYDKFFRAVAYTWLTYAEGMDYMPSRIQDSHPLEYLRVNVTLAQFDEFQETYNIQPGDGMYIPPEERIAIW